MSINPLLLEILCCPAVHDGCACHGSLYYLGDSLRCESCGLIYPIEDGIPVLLADHAKKGDMSSGESVSAPKQENNGGNK
ncbi:MAG: Trm112 family protein [Holophagales bacterium]|nr:Trm112 family protein [Holophagales bacterium]